MVTIDNNNKKNIIGYVCKNNKTEHFSQSSNYNIEGFSNNEYASVEGFSNNEYDSIEHFAENVTGNEGDTRTVDCQDSIKNQKDSGVGAFSFGQQLMDSWIVESYNVNYCGPYPWSKCKNKTFPCNNPSCTQTINNQTMNGDPTPGQKKKFIMKAKCVNKS
jgi:hypothetical protein